MEEAGRNQQGVDIPRSPVVVKVGGSLFDLPDLGPCLGRWLESLRPSPLLLVPGGGPTADVVRQFDQRHGLGQEAAHWLALRALSLNAHFLAALLPAVVVEQLEDCRDCWRRDLIPVLDSQAFACADEGHPGCLPHTWEVTSDSVAARIARVLRASRLVLLKSINLPVPIDWGEAGRLGYVDAFFAQAVGPNLQVEVVNLRHWPGEAPL